MGVEMFIFYFDWVDLGGPWPSDPLQPGRVGPERAQAVEHFLSDHNMIPVACMSGIKVLSSGDGEGGGSWATFKCREIKGQEQHELMQE